MSQEVALSKVTLDLRSALGIFGSLVVAVAVTIGCLYAIASELGSSIQELDSMWQARIATVTKEISGEIDEVDLKIDKVILRDLAGLRERILVMEQKEILPDAARRIENLRAETHRRIDEIEKRVGGPK